MTDVIGANLATGDVDCGSSATFPYTLAAGESLTCSYCATLTDATDATNTATVAVSGFQGTTCEPQQFTAQAAFVFEDCVVNVIDEAATVVDLCVGGATTDVLAANSPISGYETCLVGPYTDCGDYTLTNTVVLTTNDLAVQVHDSCTTLVTATRDNFDIIVTKTADPSLTRTYTWCVAFTRSRSLFVF